MPSLCSWQWGWNQQLPQGNIIIFTSPLGPETQREARGSGLGCELKRLMKLITTVVPAPLWASVLCEVKARRANIWEEKSYPVRRQLSFGEGDKQRAEKVFPFSCFFRFSLNVCQCLLKCLPSLTFREQRLWRPFPTCCKIGAWCYSRARQRCEMRALYEGDWL